MTNSTIHNVPRELLGRVLYLMDNYIGTTHPEEDEIRAILSAPSPAGVDGPVRNFKTREGYDVWDKLCAIPKFGFLIGPSGGVVKVADIGNWIDRDEAQSVVDEAQCEVNLLRHEASDAQSIIDGLRGEVERLQRAEKNDAIAYKAALERQDELRTERDKQAQRIGELEGLLRDSAELIKHGVFEDGYCCCGSSVDSHGLGDGHSPVDALAYHAWQVCERIDAALSAGKEGE